MTFKYKMNDNIVVMLKGTELARKQTEHQLLLVIDTPDFGRVLMIGQDENDLCIQFSEKDEGFYHEIVVHPAMAIHPNPKKVLIIGGGDGGVAREVLKHGVDSITIVDIDQGVVDFTKEYFPQLGAYDDERVNLIIGDGKKFIEESTEKYDVIIVDLTDPHGPATQLFTQEFYQTLHDHLTENGVISAQAADPVNDPQIIGRVHAAIKNVFPQTYTYGDFIPAYLVHSCYVIGAKQKTESIATTLKERQIKLAVYTPEELQGLLDQPGPIIRKALSKQDWTPSTANDPVHIDQGTSLFS